jgi:hypothetical protein
MEKENYVLSNISVSHGSDSEDNVLFGYNICSRVAMYRRFRGSCFLHL